MVDETTTADDPDALFENAVDAKTTIVTETVEFDDGWSTIGLSVFEPIDASHAPSDADASSPIDVDSSGVARW